MLTMTPTPTSPVILSRTLPAIAYLSKPRKEGLWTIYLMGSDGSNRIPLIEASSDFTSAPSWSPGGDRLAFVSDRDGDPDIWVIRREGGDAVNLTHDKAKDNSPAWSPDGQWIAFASVRDSLYWEIYAMHADGTGVQRLTWWEDASDLWPCWSPDGSRLAFASKRDGNWEIYMMASDGSDLRRLTDHPADDTHPAWSPDGSQIAFESTRDGYADVYVVPAGGGEATNLTRLAWATDLGPTWSPDGSRIAFYSDRNGDWDIWVMAADGSDVQRLTTSDTQDQLPAWRP
jgi:Tol biopolymer transport system component